MQGQDVDEKDPSVWYVPVIVSNGRQDTDKGASEPFVFLAKVADIDAPSLKLATHLSCSTASTIHR